MIEPRVIEPRVIEQRVIACRAQSSAYASVISFCSSSGVTPIPRWATMLPISEDEMRPLPSWCAGRWDGEGGEVEVGEVNGLVWRDGIGGGSGREERRECV